MLMELTPGLKCKKCASRMEIGTDIYGGGLNLVLKEDQPLQDEDFSMKITCMNCMTRHEGVGFIRNSIFRGIYKYHTETPADDKTEGAKIYNDI